MEIAKKNYRIAVAVMMMEHEFAATRVMMASLIASARPGRDVSISLLLNGARNREIQSYFTRIENLTFYSSPENLGVAGGRNFLMTRPEVIGADIIMILDNDLLLPEDYVDRMARFLVSRPGAGLVGPVMLWAAPCRGFLDARRLIEHGGPAAGESIRFASDDLKRFWIENGTREDLYYLGTHSWFLTDAMATPSSVQNVLLWLENKTGLFRTCYLHHHSDPALVASIKGGLDAVETRVVNGGGQVLRSSLLSRVGLLDPAYHPYGHEDHELSIRVERAGYHNYTDCDTFVLHGIDERQPVREHPWLKEMYARRRTITTRKAVRSRPVRWLVLTEILVHTLVSSALHNLLSCRFTFPSVRGGLRGFFSGLRAPLTDGRDLVEEAVRAAAAARGKAER
jgi:GT2 family glycosyltransferase